MALLDLIWESEAQSQLGDALAYISKSNQAAAQRLKNLTAIDVIRVLHTSRRYP